MKDHVAHTSHKPTEASETVVVHPASADSWQDVVEVFGANGGSEGCWCMYWLASSGPDYARMQGEPARLRLHRLVTTDQQPGLLAYRDQQPVGWCAVAPRPSYIRLQASRTLRPDKPDDPTVWAVPCFYVKAGHRQKGVADHLLGAALEYASDHGAHCVQAYPNDSDHRQYSAGELYMGTVELFARHGFEATARPSPGRVIMERMLTTTAPTRPS
jgi:GNAT superfamily N-acetyltransferase